MEGGKTQDKIMMLIHEPQEKPGLEEKVSSGGRRKGRGRHTREGRCIVAL